MHTRWGVGILLGATLLASCQPMRHVQSTQIATSARTDEARWGRFVSKRFGVSLPLPEGRQWRINDHSQDQLVATHAPTNATVRLIVFGEHELVNHARCQERAEQRGLLGLPVSEFSRLAPIDDELVAGPEPYESRILVATRPVSPQGVEGYAFVFGATLRQCLFAVYTTRETASDAQRVVPQRLATAATQILRGIESRSSLEPGRAPERVR